MIDIEELSAKNRSMARVKKVRAEMRRLGIGPLRLEKARRPIVCSLLPSRPLTAQVYRNDFMRHGVAYRLPAEGFFPGARNYDLEYHPEAAVNE